jgi:RNA polymerase sigma-70 factor (ECF subfamily)
MSDQGDSNPDDLLRRIHDGDGGAFDEFFEENRAALTRAAARDLGYPLLSVMAASDVVQETHIRTIEIRGNYEWASLKHLRGWMFGILKNVLREKKRGLLAQKRTPAREKRGGGRWSEDDEFLDQISKSFTSPSQAASRKDVRHAIERLEPEERDVILLRFYDGLTIDGIAANLKVDPRTVRHHLDRALRTLLRFFNSGESQ